MKKVVIFFAIILFVLAIWLVYLVVEPYLPSKYQLSQYIGVNNNSQSIVESNTENTTEIMNNEMAENTSQNVDNVENIVENTTYTNDTTLAEIVNQMSSDDINLYNISFTSYEGNNMNGQMVRALIEGIYSSNRNNIDNSGLFVAVTQDYDNTVSSTIGIPGDLNNTEDVVEECNEELYDLKYDTDTDDSFNIECIYSEGIVVEVQISKVK